MIKKNINQAVQVIIILFDNLLFDYCRVSVVGYQLSVSSLNNIDPFFKFTLILRTSPLQLHTSSSHHSPLKTRHSLPPFSFSFSIPISISFSFSPHPYPFLLRKNA